MKKPLVFSLLAVAALVGGVALWWASMPVETATKAVARESETTGYNIATDLTAIFQKAFWKRPNKDDKILQAECRERIEDGEGAKWRWFIIVQPSAALKKYLIDDNAFLLVRSESVKIVSGAPAWFSITGVNIDSWHSLTGGMQISYSREKNLLYASGIGRDFRAGASNGQPAPIEPLVQTGGIPLTRPSGE